MCMRLGGATPPSCWASENSLVISDSVDKKLLRLKPWGTFNVVCLTDQGRDPRGEVAPDTYPVFLKSV